MKRRARRIAGVAGVLGVAGVAWLGVAAADATTGAGIGDGPDWVSTAVANPLAGATTRVAASALADGRTQLTLEVEGIDAPAGTHLGAHLHVAPCGTAATSSGGHYRNADARGTLRAQEIWLDLHVDGNGEAVAVATRSWAIDSRADRSVVIHVEGTDHATGAAGARLACTDLDS